MFYSTTEVTIGGVMYDAILQYTSKNRLTLCITQIRAAQITKVISSVSDSTIFYNQMELKNSQNATLIPPEL